MVVRRGRRYRYLALPQPFAELRQTHIDDMQPDDVRALRNALDAKGRVLVKQVKQRFGGGSSRAIRFEKAIRIV